MNPVWKCGWILALAACVAYAGCEQKANPVSPTPADPAIAGSSSGPDGFGVAPNGPGPGGAQVPFHLLHPVQFPMDQGVLAFPPRNEPNAFYADLQVLYRDYLKRSQTALSYVDPEGENVWLTEYFRFYLNGCSHQEAMSRAIAEIRSGTTSPVCGGETLVFPPRNLPYEFQAQLESTYREILGRSQSPYYVDSEGANVWLAQYLRFRVTGEKCGHAFAENKVFAEIRGGGVQPPCAGKDNDVVDTVDALDIVAWDLTLSSSGSVGLYLIWSDPSVDLDLYLTSASCSDYPPASCTILAESVGEIGTSEQVTFSARAGEHYRVWVDNFSAKAQTFWLSYTTTQGVTLSAGDAGLERSSRAVYGGQKPAGARKIR